MANESRGMEASWPVDDVVSDGRWLACQAKRGRRGTWRDFDKACAQLTGPDWSKLATGVSRPLSGASLDTSLEAHLSHLVHDPVKVGVPG